MLTKFSDKEISRAKKELKKRSQVFYRLKKKKRITTHIRVSVKAHKKLKDEAKIRKLTISKLIDKIPIENNY